MRDHGAVISALTPVQYVSGAAPSTQLLQNLQVPFTWRLQRLGDVLHHPVVRRSVKALEIMGISRTATSWCDTNNELSPALSKAL
jgi:hypothetical protein